MKTPLYVLILAALLSAACDNGMPRADMPMGPSSMPAGAGQGGMGAMASMGMVASEFDYLAEMIPHHEEAVATAQLLLRGTEREDMRRFAATIIDTQTAEIRQMQAWLAEWYPGRDASVTYRPMMRDLTALQGSALDRVFLEDMIPHHMMAVMMSQQLLAAGLAAHPAVVPFAANIRDTQRREIRMMSAWLRDWFRIFHAAP